MDIPQPHPDAGKPWKGPHVVAPIPFDGGTASPNDCQGLIVGLSKRHTHGECFRCPRWANGKGGSPLGRLVTQADGSPRCASFPVTVQGDKLSADEVRDEDETAGLHRPAPSCDGGIGAVSALADSVSHGTNVAAISTAQKPCGLGALDRGGAMCAGARTEEGVVNQGDAA